jgi:hypothetical protein
VPVQFGAEITVLNLAAIASASLIASRAPLGDRKELRPGSGKKRI